MASALDGELVISAAPRRPPDGVGGLGEEGQEQVEGVGVDGEQLQPCVKAVFARSGGERLGIG